MTALLADPKQQQQSHLDQRPHLTCTAVRSQPWRPPIAAWARSLPPLSRGFWCEHAPCGPAAPFPTRKHLASWVVLLRRLRGAPGPQQSAVRPRRGSRARCLRCSDTPGLLSCSGRPGTGTRRLPSPRLRASELMGTRRSVRHRFRMIDWLIELTRQRR